MEFSDVKNGLPRRPEVWNKQQDYNLKDNWSLHSMAQCKKIEERSVTQKNRFHAARSLHVGSGGL
jgi:hypothetical protein